MVFLEQLVLEIKYFSDGDRIEILQRIFIRSSTENFPIRKLLLVQDE